MRYTRAWAPVALFAVAAAGVAVACSGSGSSGDGQAQVLQAQNPPGNNGTVKIEEFGSTDDLPENDPHVGCRFVIEFRGFDQGADLMGTWSLAAQPPSGDGQVIDSGSVPIGEDPAGGANDLDATVNITVTADELIAAGLVEQPQQGFHLKLTVHADGSQGADTKFKVFWVQGCAADAGADAGEDAAPPDAAPPDAAPPDAAPPDAAPPQDAAVPPTDAAVPPTDAAAPQADAGPKME